jgi:hypothetical protein
MWTLGKGGERSRRVVWAAQAQEGESRSRRRRGQAVLSIVLAG